MEIPRRESEANTNEFAGRVVMNSVNELLSSRV